MSKTVRRREGREGGRERGSVAYAQDPIPECLICVSRGKLTLYPGYLEAEVLLQ